MTTMAPATFHTKGGQASQDGGNTANDNSDDGDRNPDDTPHDRTMDVRLLTTLASQLGRHHGGDEMDENHKVDRDSDERDNGNDAHGQTGHGNHSSPGS